MISKEQEDAFDKFLDLIDIENDGLKFLREGKIDKYVDQRRWLNHVIRVKSRGSITKPIFSDYQIIVDEYDLIKKKKSKFSQLYRRFICDLYDLIEYKANRHDN